MRQSSNRSLLGVLLGFACAFPLLLRRPKETVESGADALLRQAQQQLAEAQARNRDRAVQVITAKNNLQAQLDQTQRMIARQTQRLESAELSEDAVSRRELSAQRDKNLKILSAQQALLSSAVEATELVKNAMRREEGRIQQLTAEALVLGAQEKQARIELDIARSKLKMTTTLAADLFAQARKKVERTKARSSLMVSVVQATEALDEAARAADHADNQELHQTLTEARQALAKSASDATLWEE